MSKVYPGYCVECFKNLPSDDVVCGTCQDALDGRWNNKQEKRRVINGTENKSTQRRWIP